MANKNHKISVDVALRQDYISSIDESAERRFLAEPLEVRMDEQEDGTHDVSGYAFKFNTRANLGLFEETISPEARDDERLLDDVRCLFNHSPNYPLARSNNGEGTLHLSWDNIGLRYSYKTPNRSYALDLRDAIKSGDVSQSSFAFTTKEDKWEERSGDIPLRTITTFKRFYDVAPVTYPAYQDATVGLRSGAGSLGDNAFAKAPQTPEETKNKTSVRDAQLISYKYN